MKLLKISVLIFILFSSLNAQWQTLNTGLPYGLESIDFINDSNGWILGNNQHFLKTFDGGLSWYDLPDNENFTIRSFNFINDTLGWATGNTKSEGTDVILKSTDGGQSWLIKKEIHNTGIISIFPVDENTIYTIFWDNTLIKSNDGGKTWSNSYSFGDSLLLNCLWFFNKDTGIVAGGYTNKPYEGLIYKTYDGGINWEMKILPEFNNIRLLKFINDSTGYFVANDGNYYELFCETRDGGNSWEKKSENNTYTIKYAFATNDTVYAISGGATVIGVNNTVIKSTNGGKTWENIETISDWSYNDIVFTNNNTGYIAGFVVGSQKFGGILLKTTDNGISWSNSILTYPFLSAYFIDQNRGFATGGETEIHFNAGDIFSTNDGGNSWIVNFSPGIEVRKCIFTDESTGFALTNSWQEAGNLFKTTDGALNWYAVPDLGPGETSFTVNEIYFKDPNIWIAGKTLTLPQFKSVIFYSPDKGKTWIKSWENPDHESFIFNSMHFINSNKGWIVGEFGRMMKYTKPEWNDIPAITDLPLKTVYFINENTGWITGGYYNYDRTHKFLWMKTSDAGAHWDDVGIDDYFIEDIEFKDQSSGWAAGYDSLGNGVILGTDDGGNRWIVQRDKLDAPLRDLHYKDGFIWAVGGLGQVYKSDGTSWIEQNNAIYANDFKLYQNYPNPFNPQTNIRFYLPQACNVKIEVYNPAGQSVKTLLDRKMIPGNHLVEFNGADLPSGLYFYRLFAGAFTATKKMILIK